MRKHIMIVDDELDYLHVVKLMLEGTGKYHVRTLSFASQAAHVAREFLPDLVLLDCMMPGVDGGEIAGQFQADPKLKNIPFLFLTCTVSEIEQAPSKCYEGLQTYCPKNIEFDQLVAVIEQKLAEKAAAAGVTSTAATTTNTAETE
jgi:CheY-like chemotaxis protein